MGCEENAYLSDVRAEPSLTGMKSLDDPQSIAAHEWRLLIGGNLVEASSGKYFATLDPSSGKEAARVPDAGAADVDRAVAAALAAFPDWRATAPRERGRLLRLLAGLLREHSEELALIDAVDGGFPVTNMKNDVQWGAELLEIFADWALELKGETIPATAEHLHYTVREPFGVVARIIPFNHPIFFAAGKIAAPLLAGNTVVLKPGDQTPLSALRMGEIFSEVLPPGVLNVLAGEGKEAGSALVRHPDVRRIAFIGSDAVGRAIQADAAAAAVKTVTLELGGKNAMIVLPDADLDQAADGVVAGMNFVGSQGQSCGSNSRLLVHRDVSDDFAAKIVDRVRQIRIGAAVDPATQMGPMVSERQLQRAVDYVDIARGEGAELLHGGSRLGECDGYFHEPTVFTGVEPRMRIAQEEVFGPLLSILSFEDPEEAVAISNGVEFGLTGSVWTNDIKQAHRIVRELEAGYVWINGSSRHFWGMPFGGVKSSGVGREESLEELLSFTQTKSVNVILD
jgi:2-formylbenzoate dehydrogenase